jgi:hypothetical protein
MIFSYAVKLFYRFLRFVVGNLRWEKISPDSPARATGALKYYLSTTFWPLSKCKTGNVPGNCLYLLNKTKRRYVMKKIFLFGLALLLVLAIQVSAQEDGASQETTADEVARELANPNNSLANLTFKNQFRWYTGDLPNAGDQQNYTLLFQPVFPFSMKPRSEGGKANLFIRPAFPFVFDQPVFDADKLGFEGVSAMGDIGFDLAYGVTEPSGLLWALGMVGTLPTATDSDVVGKQLRLGPEGLIAKFYSWGLWAIFPNHQWDVSGWSDSDFSTTQLQSVLKFLPGQGWSVGSTPIMVYDWESEA